MSFSSLILETRGAGNDMVLIISYSTRRPSLGENKTTGVRDYGSTEIRQGVQGISYYIMAARLSAFSDNLINDIVSRTVQNNVSSHRLREGFRDGIMICSKNKVGGGTKKIYIHNLYS